jgi:hypothetical protein
VTEAAILLVMGLRGGLFCGECDGCCVLRGLSLSIFAGGLSLRDYHPDLASCGCGVQPDVCLYAAVIAVTYHASTACADTAPHTSGLVKPDSIRGGSVGTYLVCLLGRLVGYTL